MDNDTVKLALNLSLEDLDGFCSSRKGKSREGCFSSEDLAIQLFKKELENLETSELDRRFAQSIAAAVVADGPNIARTLDQEREAFQDHSYALELDGKGRDSAVSTLPLASTDLDDTLLEKLEVLYVSGYPDVDETEDTEILGESSTAGARNRSNYLSRYRKCGACREEVQFGDVACAPCGHEYCRECLCSLFEASYSNESLFPPRCCKEAFVLESIRIFLTPKLVRRYEEATAEFSTFDRIYCAQPTCSSFIKPEHIQDGQAICQHCGASTCQWCKLPEHGGECTEDEALQAVLRTATENGWQRCSSCRRVIELDLGCHHITCICGAQFCYLCGERWKLCGCAQWREDRLLARANQIIDRHQPPIQARQDQLLEAVENLRTNHQCQHERWRYVDGPHRCEECYFNLPAYIFECRQCRILACNRCRRNRL